MGMRHEPPNTAPYTSDRLDNAEFDNLQICNEIALLLHIRSKDYTKIAFRSMIDCPGYGAGPQVNLFHHLKCDC